jgi:hypothetical protein
MIFGAAPTEVRRAIRIFPGKTGPAFSLRQELHVSNRQPSLSGASGTARSHQIVDVGYLLEWAVLWADDGDLLGSIDDLCPAVIVFLAVRFVRSLNEVVLCQPLHGVRYSEEYNRQRASSYVAESQD